MPGGQNNGGDKPTPVVQAPFLSSIERQQNPFVSTVPGQTHAPFTTVLLNGQQPPVTKFGVPKLGQHTDCPPPGQDGPVA